MRADSAQQSGLVDRSLWVEALAGVPAITAEQWQHAPWLLRWLIATRASVLPLTLFAVLFAWCLAWPASVQSWLMATAVLAAMLLAHATNNLINDWVDHRRGLDQYNYFRTQYGVHVLESGICDSRRYLGLLWVTGSLALLLGLVVCLYVGGWAYAFAGAGAVFVLFYTYPLKHWALGELAVLLTWGPLMVGGAYLCIAGEVSAEVLWAGTIYGLGPTVVIFAKHTDKAQQDRSRGVLTLPVLVQPLLGESTGRLLVPGLALLQLAAAIAFSILFSAPGMLGVLLGLPALLTMARVAAQPRPTTCPPDYPAHAWPLWYTTYGFVYARNAGTGLLLGMLLQRLLG